MKNIYIIFCFLLTHNLSFSQDSLRDFLTYNEYLSIVKEHHPVSFQANLKLKVRQLLKKSKRWL